MKALFRLLIVMLIGAPALASNTAREIRRYDFVNLAKIDDTILIDMMYASDFNFVGERIHGYKANICYLTRATARQLSIAAMNLQRIGEEQGRELRLLVRDCYRPQKASDQFRAWAQSGDERMKDVFFPDYSSSELHDGYIATRSGHSAGSTVDLTVVELRAARVEPLDMGTIVDFFSPKSATYSPHISADARANRALLLEVMRPEFVNYRREWWHFTLRDQPHPGKHFNFDVEPTDMRVPASLIPTVENP